MIRRRRPARADRPLVLHLTTADISLALLLEDQLKAFMAAGYDVVGVSAAGPFVQSIEDAGIRHLALRSATRSRSLKADLKTAAELWNLIRRVRPDIVHTHNPKPGVYGRIVAAAAGVPVVVNTVHGLYATATDPLTRRVAVYAMERLAASFSDAELIQNPEDLATLERLRVPVGRLHLLGNGIDLARFSPQSADIDARRRIRSEVGASDESVVVTAVGRLVREKGYPELFDAAARIRRSHPQAVFVVAGPADPSKEDALTQEELEAAQRAGVRLLGHRDDVEAIYAASDIYVLASHREGFPRSAMEASAMGLPVVATDIRGCRQVVDDGITGLLVPVSDDAALSEAIISLIDDPERRREMGRLGERRARQLFDQNEVIRITLGVYSDQLQALRAGARRRRCRSTR